MEANIHGPAGLRGGTPLTSVENRTTQVWKISCRQGSLASPIAIRGHYCSARMRLKKDESYGLQDESRNNQTQSPSSPHLSLNNPPPRL